MLKITKLNMLVPQFLLLALFQSLKLLLLTDFFTTRDYKFLFTSECEKHIVIQKVTDSRSSVVQQGSH